jgi:hypothetical protein
VHTDTPQIAPCLCTAESMYAPGFYDYAGGELCFYNGMYADDYGPEGCLLLSGHRAVRAPLWPCLVTIQRAKAVRAREGEMEGFWAPHAT